MRTTLHGDNIRFCWEVGDNYVGGSRPQYTEFSKSAVKEMIEDGEIESLSELMQIVNDEVQYEYEQVVYLSFDEEEAKETLAKLFPELPEISEEEIPF